jgi:hypothetical protein
MHQQRKPSTGSIGKPPVAGKIPYSEETKKDGNAYTVYDENPKWNSGKKTYHGRPPLDSYNNHYRKGHNHTPVKSSFKKVWRQKESTVGSGTKTENLNENERNISQRVTSVNSGVGCYSSSSPFSPNTNRETFNYS